MEAARRAADARTTAAREALSSAGRDAALALILGAGSTRFALAAVIALLQAFRLLAGAALGLARATLAGPFGRASGLLARLSAALDRRRVRAGRAERFAADPQTRLLLVILAVGAGLTVAGFALNDEARAFVEGLPPEVRSDMRAVTRWGKSDWILVPLLVGLLAAEVALRRRLLAPRCAAFARHVQRIALYGFAVIAISGVAAIVLKFGLGHPRPHLQPAVEGLAALTGPTLDPDRASFPSGHATTMAALAVGLAFLWPRLALLVAPFALTVALSRSVVGAHFLSDIAAGLLLGAASALVIAGWFADRRLALRRGGKGLPARRRFPTRWVRREIGAHLGFFLASFRRTDDTGAR